MNFAQSLFAVFALASVFVLASETKGPKDSNTSTGSKDPKAAGVSDGAEADPTPDELFASAASLDASKALTEFADVVTEIVKFISTYTESDALPIMKAALPFFKAPQEKMNQTLDALVASDEAHKESHAMKLLQLGDSFAEIFIMELGETPKLPEDHKTNIDKKKANEATTQQDLAAIVDEAKKLKAELKVAVFEKSMKSGTPTEKPSSNISKEKLIERISKFALLTIKVAALNSGCDTFRFLQARVINQIGIITPALHFSPAKVAGKAEKLEVLPTYIGKNAIKVACAIRPLFTTAVFRIVLGFILGMSLILGIATVVLSKKADAKKHH